MRRWSIGEKELSVEAGRRLVGRLGAGGARRYRSGPQVPRADPVNMVDHASELLGEEAFLFGGETEARQCGYAMDLAGVERHTERARS